MIWTIIINDLPKLKQEVSSLLESEENETSSEPSR